MQRPEVDAECRPKCHQTPQEKEQQALQNQLAKGFFAQVHLQVAGPHSLVLAEGFMPRGDLDRPLLGLPCKSPGGTPDGGDPGTCGGYG